MLLFILPKQVTGSTLNDATMGSKRSSAPDFLNLSKISPCLLPIPVPFHMNLNNSADLLGQGHIIRTREKLLFTFKEGTKEDVY